MNLRKALPTALAMALGCGSGLAELEVIGTSPSSFEVVDASETSPLFQTVFGSVNPWGIDCHADTGVLYFSDPTAGVIRQWDPAAFPPVVTPFVTRPGPGVHGIDLDEPNGRLFFLDSADDSINVADLGTGTVTPLIAGFEITRPNDLVWDAGRGWVIFTDSGANFIGAIDAAGNITGGFFVPEAQGAWGIAVHPQTGGIYFSSHDLGAVYRLQPTGTFSAIVTPVATGLDRPRGLEFDRYGRLFCMESGQDRVVRIDLGVTGPAPPDFAAAINGRAFVIYESTDKDGDFLTDSWERRFASSLHELDATSDGDGDGRTALDELIFNGSPEIPEYGSQIDDFDPAAGGGVFVAFEGPASGFDHDVLVSSDLQNWITSPEPLTPRLTGDPLFRRWEVTLDPVALGLDPKRVFIQVEGDVAGP